MHDEPGLLWILGEIRLLSANSASRRNGTHECSERMMLHWSILGMELTFSYVQCGHRSRCLHFLTHILEARRENGMHAHVGINQDFLFRVLKSSVSTKNIHFYLCSCKCNYFRQMETPKTETIQLLDSSLGRSEFIIQPLRRSHKMSLITPINGIWNGGMSVDVKMI